MARKKVTTPTPPAKKRVHRQKSSADYERGMTGYIVSHIRESVERAVKLTAKRTIYADIELELDTKELRERFEALLSPANMEELAQGLATTYLVSTLEQLWAQGGGNNPQEHLPEIWTGFEKSQDAADRERDSYREPKVPQRAAMGGHPMLAGFTALKKKLTDMKTVSTTGKAGVHIGSWPQMMDMQLSQYMEQPSNKNHRLNSFLFAVEFGTGIEENVGGPQWVRTAGAFKSPSGVWRYGAADDEGGALWQGQKGFHFLFSAGNRERRPEYYSAFMDNAKAYSLKFLKAKLRK